jgi:hypothetical protein
MGFSTQFTRISKTQVLFEIPFCTPAPDRFSRFTDKSLVHEKLPGINSNLAIGSLGPMGAAARRNPAASVGVLAGEAVGKV